MPTLRRLNTGNGAGSFVKFLVIVVLFFVLIGPGLRLLQQLPALAGQAAATASTSAGSAVSSAIKKWWDILKCKIPLVGGACTLSDSAETGKQSAAQDRKPFYECLERAAKQIDGNACSAFASCGPSDLRPGSAWMACEESQARVFLSRSDNPGLFEACKLQSEGEKLGGGMFSNAASSAKRSTCSGLEGLMSAVRTAWNEEWWRKFGLETARQKLENCAREKLWVRPCGQDVPITTDANAPTPVRTDAKYIDCVWGIMNDTSSGRTAVDATDCQPYQADTPRLVQCVVDSIVKQLPDGRHQLQYCSYLPAP